MGSFPTYMSTTQRISFRYKLESSSCSMPSKFCCEDAAVVGLAPLIISATSRMHKAALLKTTGFLCIIHYMQYAGPLLSAVWLWGHHFYQGTALTRLLVSGGGSPRSTCTMLIGLAMRYCLKTYCTRHSYNVMLDP